MIEKIGTEEGKWVSTPCKEMIKYLELLIKNNRNPIVVAEIGVGVGATSLEIAKRLRREDSFHFYSFEDEVDELYDDLSKMECVKCNLVPFGNSHKTYDSYCWALAKLALDESSKNGVYDLVYLDAAHSLLFSGLGCVILKQLIRRGGLLIIDDLDWNYGKHINHVPELKEAINKDFTDEQIETNQIQMAVDLFMKTDREWTLMKNTGHRAVYMKGALIKIHYYKTIEFALTHTPRRVKNIAKLILKKR